MSLRSIAPLAPADPGEGDTTYPCALTAADLMSTPVQTVDADASMAEAWALMLEGGHRHLAVRSQGRCCGVLDDRTLFAHWPSGPFDLEASRVRALLRPRTSCVLPTSSAATVASIMVTEDVDAVPVTDDAGHLVGIVTGKDLAAAIAEHGLARRP